jgi:hypothetical protein
VLKVSAGKLLEALRPARRHPTTKRAKPLPVSLEYEFVAGALAVIEARHGAFANSIPAFGNWPEPVQVDGLLLYRAAATWPGEAELELSTDANALTIRAGKSVFRITRVDQGGLKPIKRVPSQPDKRHKGKVEVAPDAPGKRVELADTWGFSARVPMPQHRDPKE